MSSVDDTAVNELAGCPSKSTPVAPSRLVPVIVIAVPPSGAPSLGETPFTVGAGGGA